MKKKIYFKAFVLHTIIITTITSCVSQKQITYFQKSDNQSNIIPLAQVYVPKIQPGDILSINISSLSPAASSFFNPFIGGVSSSEGLSSSGSLASDNQPRLNESTSPGFLVDEHGIIEIPLIGQLKVGGLTISQAKSLIKDKVKTYLKEPIVYVRFINYRISLLGEVAKPGTYTIPNEKITLPEAISMAGDLTIYGKRENVQILRDNNGSKEFSTVDLTKTDFFSSPYYYLHNEDVVYIAPNKGRIAQTDKVYQVLPIILSVLSLVAIVISRKY